MKREKVQKEGKLLKGEEAVTRLEKMLPELEEL